jgi:LPXTG-motif cell wall-anchored protein
MNFTDEVKRSTLNKINENEKAINDYFYIEYKKLRNSPDFIDDDEGLKDIIEYVFSNFGFDENEKKYLKSQEMQYYILEKYSNYIDELENSIKNKINGINRNYILSYLNSKIFTNIRIDKTNYRNILNELKIFGFTRSEIERLMDPDMKTYIKRELEKYKENANEIKLNIQIPTDDEELKTRLYNTFKKIDEEIENKNKLAVGEQNQNNILLFIGILILIMIALYFLFKKKNKKNK